MTRKALKLRDEYDQVRERARALVELARRGGLRPPEFLLELASELAQAEAPEESVVPVMKPPTVPPAQAPMDAIWVDATSSAVQTRTLVLAILAKEKRPMPLAEIYDTYVGYREVNRGSLSNTGSYLEQEGLITRDGRHGTRGWEVVDPTSAPILWNDYVWAPPQALGATEVAWYRRAAIQHILRTLGGQQQMQIVHHLGQMPWVPGRKEKDTVKADLEALRAEGLVHRTGHSKKWQLRNGEGSQ